MFRTFEEAQAFTRDRAIAMVDLKFCDLWGRWHHVTLPSGRFTPGLMESGVGFDGSSVGFKTVSAGDMVLVPDLSTGFLDPFWEVPTLSFVCSTLEADTRQVFPYDPRNIATRAEEYLKTSGVADASMYHVAPLASAAIVFTWDAVDRKSGDTLRIDMVGLYEVGSSGQFSSATYYFDSAKAKPLAGLGQ